MTVVRDLIPRDIDLVVLAGPEDIFSRALVLKATAHSLRVRTMRASEFWPLVSVSTGGRRATVWPTLPLLVREDLHELEQVDASLSDSGPSEEVFSLFVAYSRLSPAPIVNRPLTGNTFYLVDGAASRLLEQKIGLRYSRREIFAGSSNTLTRHGRGLWCKDWIRGRVFSADATTSTPDFSGPVWARDALSAGCYLVFLIVGDWVYQVNSTKGQGHDDTVVGLVAKSRDVTRCLGLVMATVAWFCSRKGALHYLVSVEPAIDDFMLEHLPEEEEDALLESTLRVLLG